MNHPTPSAAPEEVSGRQLHHDAGGGVRLYVGADAQNVQCRRFNLTGYRCFSGAYGPMSRFTPEEAAEVTGLLDSGAFSDSPGERLSPEEAMLRQLHWEREAERWWGYPWRAETLVGYDQLIDEKWTGQARKKQRWSIREADHAVDVTVAAAAHLVGQRECLAPRRLCLAVQGVDATQYEDCLRGVLSHTQSIDIIGLGGWCILGWHRSWIPTFFAAMNRCLPLIASAGIGRVHIFGVMYQPVLGRLLWLADQHGLAVSTDSSGPVLATTWKNQKKAGAVKPTWEENVAWWQTALAELRTSRHYHEPTVQGHLFDRPD